jgi:hypothetical protein
MVDDHLAASSVENSDCLQNRLKEATADDSRRMVEEFVKAFYLQNSEGGCGPEREEVTS